MVVIAKVNDDKYICEVNHTELEKFLDLYYGNLKRLKVGDIVDLGAGHNFYKKTCQALTTTEKFIKDNKDIIQSIMQGFKVLGNEAEKGLAKED